MRKGDKEGATKMLLDLDKRGAELPPVQWDAENNLARIYCGDRTDRRTPTDGSDNPSTPFSIRGRPFQVSTPPFPFFQMGPICTRPTPST